MQFKSKSRKRRRNNLRNLSWRRPWCIGAICIYITLNLKMTSFHSLQQTAPHVNNGNRAARIASMNRQCAHVAIQIIPEYIPRTGPLLPTAHTALVSVFWYLNLSRNRWLSGKGPIRHYYYWYLMIQKPLLIASQKPWILRILLIYLSGCVSKEWTQDNEHIVITSPQFKFHQPHWQFNL